MAVNTGKEYNEFRTDSGDSVLDDANNAVRVILVSGSLSAGLPVSISSALPSGTNHIGKVTVYPATDLIKDGATDLQPKFAVISARSAESNTVVAAVTGKRIRVLSSYMMSSGTVVAQFKDGSNGTQIGGAFALAAQTGAVLPPCQWGWFTGSTNTLLSLHLSSAVYVDGGVTYIEVV